MSPHRLKNIAALAAAAFCAFTAPAGATSLTWSGGVGSASWTNGGAGWLNGGSGATWNNSTPDAAVFTSASAGPVNVDGAVTVGNITNSSGIYSLAGTGTLTLSSTTWDVASGLTNTVSTALSGTTGLIKSGNGVLLFSGVNKNFTGGVTINGGAIQIASAAAGALGTANNTAVTLNGGALYTSFAANTTVNYAITVTNAGELRNLGTDTQRFVFASNKIDGGGTLTLSFGTNNTRFDLGSTTQTNFTGKWVIDSGNNTGRFVQFGTNTVFGSASGDDAITLTNNGTILVRYNGILGSATQGITIATGGGRINAAGSYTNTVAAKISGVASNTLTLGLDNNSILILSNTNNSYAGDTSIVQASSTTNGTVRLGAAGVIPDGASAGNVTVNAGTTLDLNGFSETINGLSGSGGINNSSNAAATLTVGGNNQSSTFSGAISNSAGALGFVKTGSGTLTLSGSSTYSGATTVSDGTLQIGSGGTSGSIGSTSGVTNNGTLAYNRSDNLTASYAISGTGAVTKSGAGTLTLSGSNSYSGTTTINAGVLEITNGSAIADTGAVTLSNVSGATLAVNSSETIGSLRGGGATGGNVSIASGQSLTVAETGTQTFAGSITNSGSVTKSGTGNLILSGSNSFSGGATVQAGRLTVANANALGSGNVLVQSVSANTATLSLSGATVSGKTVTLDSTSAKAILLSTAGASTWNGTITLAGGAGAQANVEFTTEGSAPLAVGGTVGGSIGNGKNLTLRGIGTTNVLSAAVNIGSTPLAKTDSGVWRITSSGNTWGTTTISVGTLEVGVSDALPDATAVTVDASGTLNLNGYSETVGSIAGAGKIDNSGSAATLTVGGNNQSSTFSGAISNTGSALVLAKTGSGTMTLSGSNAYSGGTLLNSGGLVAGNANAFGTGAVAVNSGTLDLGAYAITNNLTNAGGTISSTGTLGSVTATGGTTSLGGGSSKVVSISSAATVNVTGASTTVATLGGGTLNVDASGAVLTNYTGGSIGVSNSRTLAIQSGSSSGVISGAGSVNKTGAGTLTLAATNTYTGSTTIESGKLVVNGSIASSAVTVSNGAALGGSGAVGSTTVLGGATISPGNSPGALTITGDLTWNNGGSYDWEVFRLPGEGIAGTDWDLLSATGSLNLTNLTGAPLFNINLYSLSATNSAGPLANWSSTGSYAWKILAANNAINTNYISPAYFGINTTQFAAHNNISGGLFALELRDNDKGLYLTYSSGAPVPEPGTWAAAALLAGGAAFVRWRRKRGARDEQPD